MPCGFCLINENRSYFTNVLQACVSQEDMLSVLWPLLMPRINNGTFCRCKSEEMRKLVADGWIQGEPYHELLSMLTSNAVKIGSRRARIEHIVEMCENGLGYDGTLLISAVIELIQLFRPESRENIISNLEILQKRLKYGLPSNNAIVIYELGFSDRVIAMELNAVLSEDDAQLSRRKILKMIRQKKDEVQMYCSNILKGVNYNNGNGDGSL